MRTSGVATLHLLLAASAICGAACESWRPSLGDIPGPPDLSEADREVSTLVTTAIGEVRRAPRDAASRARLGMVYEANGFEDLARRAYEQAVAGDPSRPRWWYRLALVSGRQGDVDLAIEAMERVISASPDYSPAHWHEGLWRLDKGDIPQAEAAFRRAIAIDRSDTGGTIGLARVLLVSRRHQEAAALLESAVAEHPRDVYLNQLLSAAYRGLGKSEAARTALTSGAKGEAVVRDPWNDEVAALRRGRASKLEQAEAHYRAHQLDAAASILLGLLAERPDDPLALKYLGATYVDMGHPDRAISVLQRALAVDDTQFDAHINLAEAYFQKHEQGRGLAEADRAIALNPAAGAAYQVKGLILRDARRYEAAMGAFALATRYSPDNPMPQVWAGSILRQLNRRREALKMLEGVLAKDPTVADALAGIAMLRMDEGALGEASDALRRGSEIDRGNTAIAEARARLWDLEDARASRSGRRPSK
jgi:tetratricopeptide (TPR) repeat protein